MLHLFEPFFTNVHELLLLPLKIIKYSVHGHILSKPRAAQPFPAASIAHASWITL
jgi:hypothetical protein